MLRGAACASASPDTVCGVAVLGCRWPGQPRLLRDPPRAKEYEGRIDCKCAAWPGGVTLLAVGGVQIVRCAWCCGGRGDAARGPADRGISLYRVIVAMWPGSSGRCALSPARANFFPGRIDLLSWLFVMMCGVLEFVGKGHSGSGAWPAGLQRIVDVDVGARF